MSAEEFKQECLEKAEYDDKIDKWFSEAKEISTKLENISNSKELPFNEASAPASPISPTSSITSDSSSDTVRP